MIIFLAIIFLTIGSLALSSLVSSLHLWLPFQVSIYDYF